MYEKSSTPLCIEYCQPLSEIYYCVPTPVLSIVNLLASNLPNNNVNTVSLARTYRGIPSAVGPY